MINFLSVFPIKFLFRPIYGGEGSILFFHKVVENKRSGERVSLMEANEIEVDFLEKIILYVRKNGYQIISLDEMSARLDNPGKGKSKFVVFTFDDGYIDNYTLAYPVFKKHQAPFTIYLTNCFPNRSAKIWWYMLEDILLEQEEISIRVRDELRNFRCKKPKEMETAFVAIRDLFINASPNDQLELIDQLAGKYNKSIMAYVEAEALSWNEIEKLSSDPLVTLAGHTMNHITLNKVNSEEALAEIMDSKVEIESKIQQEVFHFAYPFGTRNEVNEPEVALVAESGAFKTATTTRMGNIFKSHVSAKFALPRIQVLGSQQKLAILDLYLSGTLPAIKNKLKRVVTL
ncbi:MAG: polysaccharide deacetylase family protein [Flavobacteriaceae bacterium]|nr:polysaccharide deacetylase family protein [Flavobacteriaceae bacterium]